MRTLKPKGTSYVYPAGLSAQCSGLEIKDREGSKEKEAKKGLKGFFTTGVGFFASQHEAVERATTMEALKAYQLRLFRAGLIV